MKICRATYDRILGQISSARLQLSASGALQFNAKKVTPFGIHLVMIALGHHMKLVVTSYCIRGLRSKKVGGIARDQTNSNWPEASNLAVDSSRVACWAVTNIEDKGP